MCRVRKADSRIYLKKKPVNGKICWRAIEAQWRKNEFTFLCSQNKRRSLTAEKIFDGYNGHKASSAGTESNARVKVTPGLLGWADIIFCMEKKHVRRIKEKYSDIIADKKVVCLNISDDYEFRDEELQELLESYIYEYI